MASTIDPTLNGNMTAGVAVEKAELQQQFDAAKADIEALQNGTSFNSAAAGPLRKLLWAKGADIAAATTLQPGADGNYFDVTVGVANIAFISDANFDIGDVIKLHFDAVILLVHSAVDLILPGGVNINTVAGDEAEFILYQTGDWRCIDFTRADGTATKNGVALGNVASAATLSTARAGYYHVTGTTGITALSTAAKAVGEMLILNFDGAVTITHNAAILVLLGNTDITTVAGDILTFRLDTATKWIQVDAYPGDGIFHNKVTGTLVQKTQSTDDNFVQIHLVTDSIVRRLLAANTAGTVKSQVSFGDDEIQIMGNTSAAKVKLGIGVSPTAALHADQIDTAGAIPVLKLNQKDVSEPFVDFIGTSEAGTTKSVTSFTTGNTIQGFVQVDINGVQRWMPFYDAPTS